MSEQPRCKTCKHWDNASRAFRQGQCTHLVGAASPTAVVLHPHLGNEDLSPLVTASDFGCVLHELV